MKTENQTNDSVPSGLRRECSMPTTDATIIQDLPAGFEELAEFLEEWGPLDTENKRYQPRRRKSFEELRHFYDRVTPRLEDIFRHLDQFEYGPLPEAEQGLFRIALGLAEVAQAVEVLGQPGVPTTSPQHSIDRKSVVEGKSV